jgi:hypothetical protein
MLTDEELEGLKLRALTGGTVSYPHVVPLLIEEILRLRHVLRGVAITQATHDASMP